MKARKTRLKSIWGDPTDTGVGPEIVVKGFDVAENGCLGGVPGGEMLKVDTFTFETGEEILRHSVVIGIALAGHALPETVVLQGLPVGGRGILDAPVGVENQALLRPLPPDGHAQGVEGQFGVNAVRKGVANNLFEAQVLDDGEIQPALAGGDVGNIPHPCLVWLGELEITAQQIGSHRVPVVGIGCPLVGFPAHGMDIPLLHQPMDPLTRAVESRLQQLVQAVQPQRRVQLVQPQKLPQYSLVFQAATAAPAPLPGIITAPGHLQQTA